MTTEKGAGPVEIVTSTAREGIAQARKAASEVIAATREKSEAVIDDTREKTYRAAAETNRLFQEHPIAAVAAAAAAGAVLAIFVPRVAIAGKTGKIAGQALKKAAASDAAQIVVAGLKDGREAALHSAAGKAAMAVGARVRSKRARATKGKAEMASEPSAEES